MKGLLLAENLSFPIDAATQTLLIFGKRGSGKSSTATRFAEQLIAGAVPIAVLDPVDVWWGLKAGKVGRRDGGLAVYVFGGAHKDLPLEPTAGALMADTIVDHRINAVFVLREFSNRDKARFVSDFAERLFARNRSPMHLFCEEAHEVMPQRPYGGEEEMLGRMTRLQKLGRTSGIGVTSITQRPASLNTNARTQAEILIAHRILGPHDRDAIDEWIKYHHLQDERQTVMETLASLKTGEAWVWAPDFPEDTPIGLRRVKMLLPETFDSRRTPKPGETAKQPKALAPVDLEKLRDKMHATIERAKAEDPRELRRQIVELRNQRDGLQVRYDLALKREHAGEPKVIEKPVLKDGQLARAERLIEQVDRVIDRLVAIVNSGTVLSEALRTATKDIAAAVASARTPLPITHAQTTQAVERPSPQARRVAPAVATSRPARLVPESATDTGGDLPPGERSTLTAVLQFDGLDRKRLAVLTGYKRSSRDAYIQRLQSKGLVEVRGVSLFATPAGRALMDGSFEPLPIGSALVQYWRSRLPDGERRTLDVLLESQGKGVEREHIDEATGYKRSSRDAYLQRLKARGLVSFVGRGLVAASDELFD